MALRTVSVCSGVGGLDLGVSLATGGQARTVRYVERDAEAASCLVARMGEAALDPAPVWDDLGTFDGRAARRSLGRIDGVIGGIPCQPHSLAGSRKGHQDDRDLWAQFRRVYLETGAWFVFLENVPGLLSSKGRQAVPEPSRCRLEYSLGDVVKGGAFQRILADLDQDWFNAEWAVLGSSDVGAPHRRRRLWVFAARRDFLAHPDSWRREGLGSLGLLDSLGSSQRDHADRCSLRPPRLGDDEAWSRVEAEAQPSVRGVAPRTPKSLELSARLRSLGNGVDPLAAAYAFRALSARVLNS